MIKAFEFLAALKTVSHAAGKRDVRYYLNGTLFRFTPDRLTLVATDGHRMAKIVLRTEGCELTGDYIVSTDSVKQILAATKLKASDDTPAHLVPDGDSFLVSMAGATVIAQRIEANYPEVERIQPREPQPGDGAQAMGVNLDYMKEACTALGPLANGKYKGLKIETWDANTVMRLTVGQPATFDWVAEPPYVLIMPMRL